GLIAGWGQRNHQDVLRDVERRRVDPQWTTKPTPRYDQKLAEPRNQMQPRFDQRSYGVDAHLAVTVEQRTAVEDGDRANLLRPQCVRPQHDLVVGTQSFHGPTVKPGAGHDQGRWPAADGPFASISASGTRQSGGVDLNPVAAGIANRWPAVGLAVGVVREGSVDSFAAHGFADIVSGTAVTPDTVFRIGSVTKTFTAVAVMQL